MLFGGIDGSPLIIELPNDSFNSVEIFLEGGQKTSITFDECECWLQANNTWKNVLLNKPATQSSLWKTEHVAKDGNNGIINGDIGVHTGSSAYPFWRVDFKTPQKANFLVLFNRIAFHANRLNHVKIKVVSNNIETIVFDGSDPIFIRAYHQQNIDRLRNRLTSISDTLLKPVIDYLDNDSEDHFEFTRNNNYAHLFAIKINMLNNIIEDVYLALKTGANLSDRESASLSTALYSILIPTIKLKIGSFLRFNTRNISKIEVRTRGKKANLSCIDVIFLDKASQKLSHKYNTLETFDYISARLNQTKIIPNPHQSQCVKVSLNSIPNNRFEIIGYIAETNEQVLLYDSSIISRSVYQIQCAIDYLNQNSFQSLKVRLTALELEKKYKAAFLLSKSYELEKPKHTDVESLLQNIEATNFFNFPDAPITRTKHGYKKTHKFHDRRKYLKGLVLMQTFLLSLGIKSIPSFGTLLGIVRDNDLILHDDDVDLIILPDNKSLEEMLKHRSNLVNKLRKKKSFTVYDPNLPGKNIPVGFDFEGQWVHIDIFPSYVMEDKRFVLNERLGGLNPINEKYFWGRKTINIHNIELEIPVYFDELLTWWYKDWKVVNKQYRLGFNWEK